MGDEDKHDDDDGDDEDEGDGDIDTEENGEEGGELGDVQSVLAS